MKVWEVLLLGMRQERKPQRPSLTAPAPATPEKIRRVLRYEPDTGKLFWLPRTPDLFNVGKYDQALSCKRWNSRLAGKEALTSTSNGYKGGTLFNTPCAAHRVAWAIYYGEWPTQYIDHVNGDPSDNRICNLRLVSLHGNNRNRAMPKSNTSGAVGVSFDTRSGKWRAVIICDRKRINLGKFDSFQEAVQARVAAQKKYGFHENHGRNGRHAIPRSVELALKELERTTNAD